MSKKSFSNQMRDQIASEINILLTHGITLEESIIIYIQGFYNLDSIKHPLIYLIKSSILTIGYLDAFKLYTYKQKEGLTNEGEEEFLGNLLDIEDTASLIAEASNNPNFLKRIIAASYEFSELDDLGKILIIKSLSDSENCMLEEISSYHTEDLKEYNQPITLETIKDFYNTRRAKQMIINGIDFDIAIIMSLYGFIRNLIKLDLENAQELLFEIAKIDYAAIKYLYALDKKTYDFKNTIKFYETNDVNIILYHLMGDQDFLRESLWNTIDVLVNREHSGKRLSIEEIQTEESKAFTRKLEDWKEV